MKWTKGEPPKTFTQTPVRIQFAYANTRGESQRAKNGKQTDSFVWLARENAWASTSDWEGYCLYVEDGYKILAWHR